MNSFGHMGRLPHAVFLSALLARTWLGATAGRLSESSALEFNSDVGVESESAVMAACQPLMQCSIPSDDGSNVLTLAGFIGSGVFGCVFEARDRNGGQLAVKFPSGHFDVKEYEALMKITQRSRSAFLLRLGTGWENTKSCCQNPCIVTEFVKGQTLSKLMVDAGIGTVQSMNPISVEGKLTIELARHIMLQCLIAFRDTMKLGFENIDQQLRNIMIEDGTQRIVFIDWGGAGAGSLIPSFPFESDYPESTPQSFWSLGYLLKNGPERELYWALIGRVKENRLIMNAEAICLTEAFADPMKPDGKKPGVFFQGQMLQGTQALLDALAKLYSGGLAVPRGVQAAPVTMPPPPKVLPARPAGGAEWIQNAPVQFPGVRPQPMQVVRTGLAYQLPSAPMSVQAAPVQVEARPQLLRTGSANPLPSAPMTVQAVPMQAAEAPPRLMKMGSTYQQPFAPMEVQAAPMQLAEARPAVVGAQLPAATGTLMLAGSAYQQPAGIQAVSSFAAPARPAKPIPSMTRHFGCNFECGEAPLGPHGPYGKLDPMFCQHCYISAQPPFECGKSYLIVSSHYAKNGSWCCTTFSCSR